MVLTTLSLRLRRPTDTTTHHLSLYRSIVLGLIALCLPLLAACGDAVTSGDGLLLASPGNGKGVAKGLNPSISISPSGLALSAIQGGSDPAQTVTISNSGNGTFNWSATTSAPWLLLSSVSGAVPGSLTVTAIVAGLAAGTYSTTITVAATGTTNSPQTIPVDLTVAPATSSTTTSAPSTSTSSSSFSTSSSSTSASPPITSTAPSTVAVSLAWDPVQDPSVTGYYIHYGNQSPNSPGSCTYTQSTFASSPTATISGLASGTTYYFAVSAYNGLESACSAEVWKST